MNFGALAPCFLECGCAPSLFVLSKTESDGARVASGAIIAYDLNQLHRACFIFGTKIKQNRIKSPHECVATYPQV